MLAKPGRSEHSLWKPKQPRSRPAFLDVARPDGDDDDDFGDHAIEDVFDDDAGPWADAASSDNDVDDGADSDIAPEPEVHWCTWGCP